jgi:site-specific recombinase XerD
MFTQHTDEIAARRRTTAWCRELIGRAGKDRSTASVARDFVDRQPHTGPVVTFASLDRMGDHPLLRIRDGSKGGKGRTVPIPLTAIGRLDQYIQERVVFPVGPKETIFVRRNGTPLNQQFVDTMLRKLAATAGVAIPEGAMAHALRHSFGSQLALRGVPLPVLQQLLGHQDPRVTTIYTRAHATELTDTLSDAGWLR